MALEVEDGSGKVNAESYVSVADCTSYHAAFGNSAWAALTLDAQEVALRKATQYIDARYRFKGERLKYDQALQWPRSGFASKDVSELTPPWPVPQVKNATCELALTASTTDLFTNEDSRAVTEETVGPITLKYGDARFGGQVRYTLVDDLLAPLVATGGSNSLGMRLTRGS